MVIEIFVLKEKVFWTLSKQFPVKDAQKICDYLIWAEMSWHKTQWVLKLIWTEPLQNIKPIWKKIIERETKLSQLVNANKQPAILIAQEWIKTSIQKDWIFVL